MINLLSSNRTTQPRSKLKLVPRFSERRLLLILGDTLFISLSGLVALWVHSVL